MDRIEEKREGVAGEVERGGWRKKSEVRSGRNISSHCGEWLTVIIIPPYYLARPVAFHSKTRARAGEISVAVSSWVR